MTGRSDLVDLNQKSIAIAIEREILDCLGMSAFFAFHPKLSARTAPKMRFAGFERFSERRLIHPCHHENASARLLLDDRRNQAHGIKFQLLASAQTQIISRAKT